MMEMPEMRRVVTTEHDGKGLLGSDEVVTAIDVAGAVVYEIWHAREGSGNGADPAATEWSLNPPAGGAAFRIADFPPNSDGLSMHRTPTIDFGYIVEGSLTLVLEDGEVELKAGDTFVQRHTNHGWVNKSSVRCRMVVLLVDGDQA